ncbi:hypothetical protein B0T10DRAFT_487861 [Thelonectria olida]|uniref:Uncharacterized protein n=1 Tax=Thelonectria olida TaxID=1576542 RepID=A0A9P8W455_9HYPO|nr:hypothetical protein B0T10DRAFT_487861 [Thelonectria olida]
MIFEEDDRYDGDYDPPDESPPGPFPFERVYPELTVDESPKWTDWEGFYHLLHEDKACFAGAWPLARRATVESMHQVQDALLLSAMDSRLFWGDASRLAKLVVPTGNEKILSSFEEPHPRDRQRKRLVLPIKVQAESNTTTIVTCPDSGSDENIVSLETVHKLEIEMEKSKAEPRKFCLANGKVVEAIGQVPMRFSFVAGSSRSSVEPSFFDCVFQVFASLAVPAIIGMEFLHMTETLSKHTDRLVEEYVSGMQSLRVSSIGTPKRNVICRLGTHIGCATADTGSDLDLISPDFAKSRAFEVHPAYERLEFADGSTGWTSGMISSSLSIGNIDDARGFQRRGWSIPRSLYVLENLNADIILGQDTIKELDIFRLHAESFIPSMPRFGESSLNIIRHIGGAERRASRLWSKLKAKRERGVEITKDGYAEHMMLEDQRENSRRESTRIDIEKKTGLEKEKAQKDEDDRIRIWEDSRERRAMSARFRQNQFDSHAIVDQTNLPYSCSVIGCVRWEQGNGFRTKNELILHGLFHDSRGLRCPFCPNQGLEHSTPDEFIRHLKNCHAFEDEDVPGVKELLVEGLSGRLKYSRFPFSLYQKES